jgi:sulfoxide reductase catalytic subunit YedY
MIIRKGDGLRSSDITPESVYLNRRQFMTALPFATAAIASPSVLAACDSSDADGSGSARAQEEQTPFEVVTTYNNFYEFGTGKEDPARNAHTLVTRPWTIRIDGLCDRPGEYLLEDSIRADSIEDRTYRLRCVEGWSMVIPWLGVPLASVLKRFEPTSQAKYVAFTTLADPKQMPGVAWPALDWPYREGLRIDEAMHPLTLLATGIYGKPLPQQNGAPLRLVVPWKYGFKSIKSIVSIRLVGRQPVGS